MKNNFYNFILQYFSVILNYIKNCNFTSCLYVNNFYTINDNLQ